MGAGLAMLVLPGPGLVVTALGLAMLALEFAWAERALGRTVDKLDSAKRTAAEASRAQKLLALFAGALVAGALVVVLAVWDVPFLPF